VARAVRALALPGVHVVERSGEGTDLIATWSDADVAIVIDAASAGAPPGTIHRFDVVEGSPGALPPAQVFRGTSHQIGLGEGIALGRVLGMLPRRLIVYGIEGQTFGDGVDLCEAVARAVEGVVTRIRQDCAGVP
jgi:hydrogenase maturation protease